MNGWRVPSSLRRRFVWRASAFKQKHGRFLLNASHFSVRAQTWVTDTEQSSRSVYTHSSKQCRSDRPAAIPESEPHILLQPSPSDRIEIRRQSHKPRARSWSGDVTPWVPLIGPRCSENTRLAKRADPEADSNGRAEYANRDSRVLFFPPSGRAATTTNGAVKKQSDGKARGRRARETKT